MKNNSEILLDEIRRIYSSAVWSHKIQEKQSDIYNEKYAILENINIIVASITSCGIFSTIFYDNIWTKIIAAILSFITIIINTYFKSFDINEKAKQNKKYANKFLVIRNKLLHLICEIHMGNTEISKISKEYTDILSELNELYVDAPYITQKAVVRAAIAIKEKQEYDTDEEIDKLLPPTLRGSINK